MNLVNLLYQGKLDEFKDSLFSKISEMVQKRLDEMKQYIAIELLDEGSNPNIMRLGKITKIRRRIRRDATGKIVIQRNATRSAMKGYRIVGKTVRRISAVQRLRRSMQLKRSWKSSRRSKLSRSLLKRKISMRRRHSMGL